MRELGRREFLLGLGAGSALAALRPMRLEAMLPREAASASLRAVNVLILGMFAVDVSVKDVILYPPKAAGHVYKAGNRNAPRNLTEGGHYWLTGVKSHTRLPLSDIHPGEFGVFHRHAINTSLAYCRIVLPMPDAITPLRSESADPGQPFFEGTPKPYQEPSSLPDVLVLTYNHVTGPVELHGFPWTPIPENGIANLSFWAMPNGPVPSDHPKKAFAALAAMIGYPHLSINSHYASTKAPPVDLHPGVPGVTSSDERSLLEMGPHTRLSTGSLTCAAYGLY